MDHQTPMDPEASAALHRAVGRVDAIYERAHQLGDPHQGSLAATDAAVPHARWVITSAKMAVGVAADHLLAWRLIVDRGVLPIYAPMTLLRAALEGGVLTRWLVDPRPASLERVGRGIAAQLADYDERSKFETSVMSDSEPSFPAAPARTAADRKAELMAARDEAGIPTLRLPGPTALVMGFGAPGYRDLSWIYRLLSAFAHAKPWSLHGTVLGPSAPTGTPGIQGGPVTMSESVIVGSTDLVAGVVETAILDLERYLRGGPSSGA